MTCDSLTELLTSLVTLNILIVSILVMIYTEVKK